MILLPVKPKYAFAIHQGRKKVEFRKAKFRQLRDKLCVVYASYPVKKIIGVFEFEVEEGSPSALWEKYAHQGEITKEDYYSYYANSDRAVVLIVKNYHPLSESVDPKETFQNFLIPQSFRYLLDEEIEEMRKYLKNVSFHHPRQLAIA